MSIKEVGTKIKDSIHLSYGDLVVTLIIIFVGLSGFGLGRLSVDTNQNSEIRLINKLDEQSATVALPQGFDEKFGLIVASKGGTKYHYPWCSGPNRMKEENKIWFNSIEEARRAGYTPAANCKGLK
ncbi:hypothetical protein IID26_01400 [Patescibacteria group bacterium]|nr:hypothetical protein [Patescibacteria group bacterium]